MLIIQNLIGVEFESDLFSTGPPIEIKLSSVSRDDLKRVTLILKDKLQTYAGVFDIKDSFSAGKDEIKLTLRPEAQNYGITMSSLARQVRQAFYGDEVQRIQRGRDEIKVFLRYPKNERVSLNNLEQMNVRVGNNIEVPLGQVAQGELASGYSTITRTDRKRSINIVADVDLTKANANEILSKFEKDHISPLLKDYPSVNYSFEGEQREQRDTLGSLFKNFALALFVVYVLLAVPFKSYLQPLIIMSAIPFGFTGAVIGHLVMGMNLAVFNWNIEGEIPDLKKMVLIGLPHTAMRDAWYALLAVWALDLKINFFGAAWVFTRLPSLFTISKNLDRQGVPWPLWWVQKYLMLKLGGIPVYRVNSKGLIHAAVEEFKDYK